MATATVVLMWCLIIHVGLMLFWTGAVWLAPDLVYRTQAKFVPVKRETWEIVMYSFLGLYKALVLVFVFVPWVALLIVAG